MYKFRCDLRGHTSDVRCIVNYDEEVIISGSRDRTCRVWTSQSGVFEQSRILCGHTDFIASLCIVPTCKDYPDGLIITGSNDHSICAYSPKCNEVLFKLTAHTDTVCCVYPSIYHCGLLSSSWDSTVIMWDLSSKRISFQLPSQKNTPVWSVIQMPCGTIITASADKILRAYSDKGEYTRSYYGHSDCVRALCPVNNSQFLSCGNDGHVLKWNTSNNTCDAAIDTVHHYLYSVSYLQSKDLTAYCGERGGIYINSECGTDVIPVPCTSVWSVTILPDGDIAAACSDGIIRIYSCEPARFADDFRMKSYHREIKMCAKVEYNERQKDLICPYLNDLSGPEVLNFAGKISNQICFVRQGFLAVMYSWSTDRWVEVAKRKGTYQYDITKKKMHNKKAYDFLFPINIDDNQPNLVLPLTLGDDIFTKINEFMTENNLSSHYGETIYNHVANTVKDDFIKASVLEKTMEECLDDNEYYNTINKYFPKSVYINFEKANLEPIFGKLLEFANNLNITISDEQTVKLKNLTTMNNVPSADDCSILLNFLDWPEDSMLPVLDLLRLALRNSTFHNFVFSSTEITNKLLSSLISYLNNSQKPVNQLMALKVYCNMFHYNAGRNVILEEFSDISAVLGLIEFPKNFSVSIQVAASSLILNLTIMTEKETSLRQLCLKCVVALINKFTDKEAFYRSFVALGNLISYEGSFFIPKPVIDTLKELYYANAIKGSQAHDCLIHLLRCFQDED